jgi:hypothetical protein
MHKELHYGYLNKLISESELILEIFLSAQRIASCYTVLNIFSIISTLLQLKKIRIFLSKYQSQGDLRFIVKKCSM